MIRRLRAVCADHDTSYGVVLRLIVHSLNVDKADHTPAAENCRWSMTRTFLKIKQRVSIRAGSIRVMDLHDILHQIQTLSILSGGDRCQCRSPLGRAPDLRATITSGFEPHSNRLPHSVYTDCPVFVVVHPRIAFGTIPPSQPFSARSLSDRNLAQYDVMRRCPCTKPLLPLWHISCVLP